MQSLTPAALRILDTASELFYDRGIHAVGVDLIAERSGITKRTLYDRFGTKDALVVAYLTARDEAWRAAVRERLAELDEPRWRALAPFDVLGPWTARHSRGCAFVNAAAELPPHEAHPARRVIAAEKRWLRELFTDELAGAGADDPAGVAVPLLLLHDGVLACVATDAVDPAEAVTAARAAARAVVAGSVTSPGRRGEPGADV